MNKRDKDKLAELLVRLTSAFNDPRRMTETIGRGAARAIVAAIRALNKKQREASDERP